MKRFLFLFLIAVAPLGCSFRGRIGAGFSVVYEEPPPLPHTIIVDRGPDYVWIEDRWVYTERGWVFVEGHWEPRRCGYRYIQGYWARRGGSWHWVPGRWVQGGRFHC